MLDGDSRQSGGYATHLKKKKDRLKSVFPATAKKENRGRSGVLEDLLLLTKIQCGKFFILCSPIPPRGPTGSRTEHPPHPITDHSDLKNMLARAVFQSIILFVDIFMLISI